MPNKTAAEIKTIQDLKDVQATLADCIDRYNLGLYNGIELSLAIMENRDPEYRGIPQPQPQEDSASHVLNEETGEWDAMS